MRNRYDRRTGKPVGGYGGVGCTSTAPSNRLISEPVEGLGLSGVFFLLDVTKRWIKICYRDERFKVICGPIYAFFVENIEREFLY